LSVNVGLPCDVYYWPQVCSQAKAPCPRAAPAPAIAAEGPLHTLDWLVGDCVDADADDTRTIEFSCQLRPVNTSPTTPVGAAVNKYHKST
jgi:hypothetical protein